ncbi:MAG TPA: Rieske (2Fe-2S) protein [Candidatus Dormibacteraeota bacterium]|nr:Rieske (2Fe-2S) protein [Candidatus Dormibacteraeota bacterium]
MAKYVIAAVDEVKPGERLITMVAGRSIGVFNVDGVFYAIRNRCPHQGAELCLGRVVAPPARSPLPGSFEREEGPPFLQCPWHGWEFDLSTGRSWFDPARVRVRAYPVDVRAGLALKAELGSPARREGPVFAETYRVDVESDYIMVTIEP